jgi:Putative DNA-binding domain
MISQAQLDQLLGKIEQDRVEKTISVNDGKKFGEAICAFSNDFPNHRQPGYLIVGVHDDGRRSNLPKDEKILPALMDFRTDGRIVPPPVITVAGLDYPDGFVAVAEVQPAFQPPVRFNGAVHIRIGPRRGTATYVVMQHGIKEGRPVKPFLAWASNIPGVFREYVLKANLTSCPISEFEFATDPYCLALLKHYHSLAPLSMEARKPIFALKPADGAIGAHMGAVQSAHRDFKALVEKLVERTSADLAAPAIAGV